MTDAANTELEGTTLSVYLYAVHRGKPVGPRDAMKGVNDSSPSVTYRHLQKLEDMGLVQKTNLANILSSVKQALRGTHGWGVVDSQDVALLASFLGYINRNLSFSRSTTKLKLTI